MISVYYIEDDEDIASLVKEYLQEKDCGVFIFSRIDDAKSALQIKRPDVVLLDWNMPDGDGTMICRWIRKNYEEIPIIFLTVRNDTGDIVAGLQEGADDYITKPFELEILYSRIAALLRRTGRTSSNQQLTCGEISVDKTKMAVFYRKKELIVSQSEYQLLLVLMENKGKTITRERLLEQIWDSNGNFVNDNTLTVTMKRLREKLEQPACIKTVRSFGYRMEEPE